MNAHVLRDEKELFLYFYVMVLAVVKLFRVEAPQR
jgi:hypothetical protein